MPVSVSSISSSSMYGRISAYPPGKFLLDSLTSDDFLPTGLTDNLLNTAAAMP